VRLDGDFTRPNPGIQNDRGLVQWGLKPGGFVLFVSTIESRKNHIGAFNAWQSLILKHGAHAVPKLVCVGNAGWLNDAVHAKLAASAELRRQVVMLSHISDEDLASLYRNCLFTLYPSHYEGWGLPVTESLSHGKASLISDASSLPEAGGDFADYFRAGSDADLMVAAETLIFDVNHRLARELRIAADFRPRPWTEIGEAIAQAVLDLCGPKPESRAAGVDMGMPAKLGVYYPIVRNFELRIRPGMIAGEMFRSGGGWWWPDDWGVWTKPQGGDLAIRIEHPHHDLRGYFLIRGVLESASDWAFEFSHGNEVRRLSGTLRPDEWRWVIVDLPASNSGLTISARLTGWTTQDLSHRTNGLDRRVTSVGLAGFYCCEARDFEARMNLTEAITLGALDTLTAGLNAQTC
jgi:hypothetical protein